MSEREFKEIAAVIRHAEADGLISAMTRAGLAERFANLFDKWVSFDRVHFVEACRA